MHDTGIGTVFIFYLTDFKEDNISHIAEQSMKTLHLTLYYCLCRVKGPKLYWVSVNTGYVIWLITVSGKKSQRPLKTLSINNSDYP